MAKLTLSDIDNESVPSASTTINANNDLVEAALENSLSRDGTSPNQMEADLDMNSNRILNLPAARSNTNTDVVRVGDLGGLVAELGVQGPPGPTGDGTGDLLSTNNLSDLDNAGTARTNLGVEINADVQAYDDGLASIAGLTTAANKILYTTSSDTYAVADLSAFGRALIDDANASAARTTLGLTAPASASFGTGSGDVVEGDDSRFTELTINTVNSSSSFSLAQAGTLVRHTSASAHAFTIDPVGTTAYPVGTVIQVRNAVGGGDVTLTRGSGVSLYLSGGTTNGNLTLGAGGLCSLIHEASDVWVAAGTGLS